jgi:ComF family protein
VLLDGVLDVLSRPRCAACDERVRSRQVFCAACSATVERGECGPSGPDGVVAFADYGGALAEALHRFKYRECPHLSRPLGHLLRSACRASALAADVVVPVPLHMLRLVGRGYNQSALLGAHVADELRVPLFARALVRVTDTRPQAELDRSARLSNLDGAFAVRAAERARVRGVRVALVDDVTTTGATLDACARVLMSAGAAAVARVVLARTVGAM